MATFNKIIKSNRLLQSKRYTIAEFDTSEAYTRVLDINSTEIYTQGNSLPTSNLPYSQSNQDGEIITSGSFNLAQYYYRLKLTPSNVTVDSGTKYNTYFTISGSDGSAISPQVILASQFVNWISNKYLTPSLATKVAESTIANNVGYNVVVSKNSTDNPNSAVELSGNDYQFDYKTGVIQFVSDSVSPTTGEYLYLSGYVYIGQTLNQFISSGSGGTPGGEDTQIQFNDGGTFGGDPRFIFNKPTGLTQLSGSFQITGSDDNIFLIKSGSIDLLRMSSSGALVFADLNHTPSPVAGGMFYSSSNLYVGIE
jgi:hypothetical protein|tara:strand:- start:5130 stop:6059 length:930 start_codon:yes stop_codon:yes gene_type:complete